MVVIRKYLNDYIAWDISDGEFYVKALSINQHTVVVSVSFTGDTTTDYLLNPGESLRLPRNDFLNPNLRVQVIDIDNIHPWLTDLRIYALMLECEVEIPYLDENATPCKECVQAFYRRKEYLIAKMEHTTSKLP
jgi:hypothetical protein